MIPNKSRKIVIIPNRGEQKIQKPIGKNFRISSMSSPFQLNSMSPNPKASFGVIKMQIEGIAGEYQSLGGEMTSLTINNS